MARGGDNADCFILGGHLQRESIWGTTFQGSPSRRRKGKDFTHWCLSPLGQSLPQGLTDLHKPRSGQLSISHLISKSQLSSNREVLDERQEGHDVPEGDRRGVAVTSIAIPGSTALGAAQTLLDPLSPAAGRCAALGDG